MDIVYVAIPALGLIFGAAFFYIFFSKKIEEMDTNECDKLDEQTDHKIGSDADHKVESPADHKVDPLTDHKVDPQVDPQVDHKIDPKVGPQVDPQTDHEIEPIIVSFKGAKYNVTNFVKKHPGGKTVIIENNGKDIEQLMLDNEHSKHAYDLLEKYQIS